jgi:hypothetical protein
VPNDAGEEDTMSGETQVLAVRFERELADLIAAVEACPPDRLDVPCADTGWPARVQLDHLAAVAGFTADRVRRIAAGEPAPAVPMAAVDAGNAQRAARAATIGTGAAVVALREQGMRMADVIRALGDAQLDRRGDIVAELGEKSVREWIEFLAIGEIERHGGALRRAIAAR